MTGTDLVVQTSTAYSRANLSERERYVIMLAKAGDLLPPNLQAGMVRDPDSGQLVKQGSVGKTFLLAETGDMLGIHPIAAMTGVHIIDGKPSISANLMSGLVRSAGHKLRVKVSGQVSDETLTATAQLIRKDDPDFTFEVTWTVEDAKRALLWPGKEGSNWRKYPKAMIKSRVISEITREGASDVLMGGNVYTPEELGVEVDEQGEPINLVQTGGDVSRETPPETPITDTPQVGVEDAVQSYIDRVSKAETSVDVMVIFQEGRTTGLFTEKIVPSEGADEIELGAWIIEIGKALKAIEEEQADEATVEPDETDDTPAVLADDADVVDAEVVDEQREAEARAFEEAEVARHEAEEAAAKTKAAPRSKR